VLNKLADVVFESYGGTLEEVPELYAERSVLKHSDKLTMPVVLATGEKDALVPVEETRKIAELMKDRQNFTYIEIPGGDHDSSIWIDVDLQTLGYKAKCENI
jgi:dipeptidyl aminopeptidase/acylaminoacyl peptidase